MASTSSNSGSAYRIRLLGTRRETFVELELGLDDDVCVELVLLPAQVFDLARRWGAQIEPCEPSVLAELKQVAWRAGEPTLFDALDHDRRAR